MVPNVFIDDLLRKMNGNTAALALVIFRKTYGWRKREDRLSTSQLMELTGQSKSTVCRGLKCLEKLKVIQRHFEKGSVKTISVRLPWPGSKMVQVPGLKLRHPGGSKLAHTKEREQYKVPVKKARVNYGSKSTPAAPAGRDVVTTRTASSRLPMGVRRFDPTPPQVPTAPQKGTRAHERWTLRRKIEKEKIRTGLYRIMREILEFPPDESICEKVLDAAPEYTADQIVDRFDKLCQGKYAPVEQSSPGKVGPRSYAWFPTVALQRLGGGARQRGHSRSQTDRKLKRAM